jgi:hypothetical protein
MDSPITFLFLRKSLNLVRVEPSPDEKNIEIAVLRLSGVWREFRVVPGRCGRGECLFSLRVT